MSFRMQAHRGLSARYPESTKAAFLAAVQAGFHIIELDPRFTKDGHCVMLHDSTVNRTGRKPDGSCFDAPTPISSLTLAQALSLDYGSHKDPRFAGERLRTLEDVLYLAHLHGVSLKFDNILQQFDEAQKRSFVNIIRASHAEHLVGITCKTPEGIAEYASLLPQCELHYDGKLDKSSLEAVREAAKGHRLTIWVPYPCEETEWCKLEKATPALCEELREYGEVGVWLLSDICQLADAICNLKADAIETNGQICPEDVFEI